MGRELYFMQDLNVCVRLFLCELYCFSKMVPRVGLQYQGFTHRVNPDSC